MKVHIETEVDLDLEMMAKAFANMGSVEQAEFFAMAYREMATFTRKEQNGAITEMGTMGRETQMHYIGKEFEKEPDAAEFVKDLYEMTRSETPTVIDNGMQIGPGFEVRDCANPENNGEWEEQPGRLAWDSANTTPLEDILSVKEKMEVEAGYVPRQTVPLTVGDHVRLKGADGPKWIIESILDAGALANVINDSRGPHQKIVHFPTKDLERVPSPILDQIREKTGRCADCLTLPGAYHLPSCSKSAAYEYAMGVMSSNGDKPPESPNDDKPPCPECGGSGEWTNPAGGRDAKTPCSKGCPKP